MRTSRGGSGQGREGAINTTRAVVLIAVLALIGVVVLAKSTQPASKSSHTTTPRTTIPTSQTTVAAATPTTTLVAPADIKLQVLNGVGHGLYAGLWTAKLKTTGYA